jgi:serine/threonine protein kinase
MDAFEDVRPLGRGAYASVRLCRRRADGAFVVVKRFHSSIAELSSKERHEMSQEIKLLSHLHHRNIVAFLGSFVADGVQHIVMEYAAGGTLARYLALREGELLPEADVLEKFVQVLAALRYCHRAGVLHRDLKPANILLSSGPTGPTVVKLTDFGVSKIIGAGGELAATVIGTPAYVSPEVVQGQGADKKADIWVR